MNERLLIRTTNRRHGRELFRKQIKSARALLPDKHGPLSGNVTVTGTEIDGNAQDKATNSCALQ